jgi:hypothetical protein
MWTLKQPEATHPLIWMRSRTSIRWGEVNMPVRRPQERRIRSVKAQVEPCGVGQLSSACGRCSRASGAQGTRLALGARDVDDAHSCKSFAQGEPLQGVTGRGVNKASLRSRDGSPCMATQRHMPARPTHVHPGRKVGERRRRVLALWAVVCPHKSLQARDRGIIISLWQRGHLPRNTADTERAMSGSTATVATPRSEARPDTVTVPHTPQRAKPCEALPAERGEERV